MYLAALLLAFFALGVRGSGQWVFYAYQGLPGMLSYGRLDPIISPGEVSAHVHQIQGGNAMRSNLNYDTMRAQSTCSTIQVQEDLSNYWAPALYSYDGKGSYTLMKAGFHVYYQQQFTNGYDPNNPAGVDKRVAFPPGLTMLAGDMYQRSINLSDSSSWASIFNCQLKAGNGPYSHDIRDFQRSGVLCDDSLRATTRFPSCWDGVADNTDLTHVVYPVDPTGVCPESHPQAFPQLTFEWYWPVQDFPFDSSREDNWVFSFGDTSGFGFHGDFVNGWDVNLLQEALDNCNVEEQGIENCPTFAQWQTAPIPPCMPSGLYPDENVGFDGQPLTALPGCNPLWTDNSTKPTCDSTPPTPDISVNLGPELDSWNYVGCPFSTTDQGLILTAHNRTEWNDMTVNACLDECKGYKYAMMTWALNCYCDNELQNGGTTESDPTYACRDYCSTDEYQFCGGYGGGALYEACEGDGCQFNANFPRSEYWQSTH